MKNAVKVKIRTEIRDAITRQVKRSSATRENLVFDSALTKLSLGSVNFATMFSTCKIGSGNVSNSFPGNTTTFTQIGTGLYSSVNFFNANMVGAIFKYGSGNYTGGSGLTATALNGIGTGLKVDVTVLLVN